MNDKYRETFQEELHKTLELLIGICDQPNDELFRIPNLQKLTDEDIFNIFKFEDLRQYMVRLKNPKPIELQQANYMLAMMDAIYRCINVRYLPRLRAEILSKHRKKLSNLPNVIQNFLSVT